MRHHIPAAAIVTLTALSACLAGTDAVAHGFAGKRFFPATLTTDDPFMADELSLPTVSTIRTPGAGDEPGARDTEISAELAKRITRDFGVSIAERYAVLSPDGGPTQYGWGNVEMQLKYQFFTSEEHEAILSFGTAFEIGGTGAQRIGADRFNTVTPAVFFGKGFGDLPDGLSYLKPLAVTGTLGGAIPLRSSSSRTIVDEDTGSIMLGREQHSDTIQYGFAVEYSLPYLQSFVRDIGLKAPFNRLIPLVEFAFESPVDRGGGGTTGTINPGIVWAGQYFQLGIEAIFPVNERTGHNVGVIAQLHFFLDDLFPQTLGRPIFDRPLISW